MESGIYAIISKSEPHKIYIGSAINLSQRKKRHWQQLRDNKHFNSKLQNYYNNQGPGCFYFYVIQHISAEYLLITEQYLLDTQKPYFNINPTAGSRLGSHHSPGSKLKTKTSLFGNKNTSMHRHLWRRVVKRDK